MKKKSFKVVALMMLLVFALVVVGGCGPKDSGDKTGDANKKDDEVLTLHMGATSSAEHSYYRATDVFMKEVEEKSGGKIKALREYGGVHGGERQMTEACMRGELDIVITSDVGLGAVFPELGFTQLPFLFKNYEDVDKRYTGGTSGTPGWMGERVASVMEAKGIKVLAFGENDYRGLSNSKKAIKSGADLQGMKIRVPENPLYIAFFKNLGTLPTPMAVTELPTALQQKTIDGQDNGAILTWSYGYYQFQKYFTKTQHMYSGTEFIINKELWDGFTPEQQKIIGDAAKNMMKKQVELNRSDVESFYKNMEAKGVQVDELTPELEKFIQDAAQKVWNDPKFEEQFGKDVMDRIKKEAGM